MKHTDNQFNTLFNLINFTEDSLRPQKGFKEQLLADLMSEPIMAIKQLYAPKTYLIEKFFKLSLPLSILLTFLMRIDVA